VHVAVALDQLGRRLDQIELADTRRHAEDWTHRFLTTALTDAAEPS